MLISAFISFARIFNEHLFLKENNDVFALYANIFSFTYSND